MVATMYAADGVGLAACQIGVDRAVFVFDCHDAVRRADRRRGLQPRADPARGRRAPARRRRRGLPVAARRLRPLCATRPRPVTGTGLDGEPVEFTGDGMLARCLQHETDHLRGTVFGDRLATKQRKKLQKQHDRAAEEFPEGWPA